MAPPVVRPYLPGAAGGHRTPVSQAASQRAVKWSRDPKVREQQLKNPNYHPPAHQPAPAHPAAGAQPARRQPSLIEMTPAQIADRAKRIVNSEVAAERLPFQQRAAQLGTEETGSLQSHAKDYAQLETGTRNLAAQNAESAKTFQNTAAEMVKKAEGPAPGAAASAEHGAVGSEAAKQQEAARNLLTAIASGAQAGTNARQQAESNYLTNLQGTVGMENAAGGKQIAGEYAKKKGEVANQEAQINVGKAGRVGKLILGTEGEQEKLKLAAGSLNVKGKEEERHAAETRSNIQNRKETQGINQAKLKNEGRKIALSERPKPETRSERLNNQKKELEIKKFLEHGNGANGKPLTKQQLSSFSGQLNAAFKEFQRGREGGASPEEIRKSLEQGGHRYTPSEKELRAEEKQRGKPFSQKELESKRKGYFVKGPKITEPAFLKAAEDIMQKEYISTETKKELRELGLPDSGWSNRFIHHPPAKGLTSPAHTGKK